MAGIYIHIPFCKQACHYCDFHFSTSLRTKDALLASLLNEARQQGSFFSDLPPGKKLETLYLGGGTPSLLSDSEISRITGTLQELFPYSDSPEITLEANPDDLDAEKIRGLVAAGVNRLSIGVQSFRDNDLKYMNRAHNSAQAESSVKRAQDAGITNISIDLIYGVPGLDTPGWKENLAKAFSLEVPHLSCYALTVEERTALSHFIRSGKTIAPDDKQAEEHFILLTEEAAKAGFVHYEISNFAKEGFRSRHNSSYWSGEPYLGLGPSAHSYTGKVRRWNVRNNPAYIRSLSEGKLPQEEEVLTEQQRFNEYVMISLRTIEGLNLEGIRKQFGDDYLQHIRENQAPVLKKGWIQEAESRLHLTQKGMLFADRIASELFV